MSVDAETMSPWYNPFPTILTRKIRRYTPQAELSVVLEPRGLITGGKTVFPTLLEAGTEWANGRYSMWSEGSVMTNVKSALRVHRRANGLLLRVPRNIFLG